MRRNPRIRDAAHVALLTLGGLVLYVPAAIGMGVAELLRRRQPVDRDWRFTLAHAEAPRAIAMTPRRKADLWSQMNLKQYFTLVPGVTAVSRGYCSFSRPLSHA